MAIAELARKTLTQLHKEVTGFDAKLTKQRKIVSAGGQNIIKEFSPLEGTPPEDVINGIYNVLQRRLLLVTRIEENSLPYLEERKAGVKADENSAILQAREAYEKIQELLPLGICSPEELAFLERKISELPEDVARQIRILPVKNERPQRRQVVAQELKPGFLGRILRLGRRKNTTPEPDTQIIGGKPRPLKPAVLSYTIIIEEEARIVPLQAAERKNNKHVSNQNPITEPFMGEIPDVAEIVGKKAILQQRILTAIFEATLANENLTNTDYARRLYQKELEEGSITEEKAVKMFLDSFNWARVKARKHGYEIYNVGQRGNPIYHIRIIKFDEEGNTQKTAEELIGINDALRASTERSEETAFELEDGTDKEIKHEFPNGKFLGKENVLPRRIYDELVKFSVLGKLPASEDLENIIFGEEIKAKKMTQKEAHIKIRDGLSLLRKKLKGTVVSLTNKGTARFPFYKLGIAGQTKEILNPAETTVKFTDRSNALETVINSDSESIVLPALEVLTKEGTLTRKYYEFLLAKHAEGVITTIEEEADYLYGGHSRAEMTRMYAMRQVMNRLLKPYGIRIEAEKRGAKVNKKDPDANGSKIEDSIITQEVEPVETEPEREEPVIVEQLTAEAQTDQGGKIRLRTGEKTTLLILSQTSPDNSLTEQEITERINPLKKVRKEDVTTTRIFIAGLKSVSLAGTGIEILHPLTEDGNPILSRHYLKLPEGKRLEDIIDFEAGAPLPKPANAQQTERIAVPVASVDLQEGKTVEIITPAVPERKEIPLPHFVLREEEKAVWFSGRQYQIRFADQWEVFRRLAGRPNQELTPQELAGLNPESKDLKALELAENQFRGFMNRFEENPRQPQIFIITGGNRYPRFTFRATIEFAPNTGQEANEYSPQS